MSDFDDALQQRLARNEQLATARARAEEEMDQAAERIAEQVEQERRVERERQDARHAELSQRLEALVSKMRSAAPHLDVRAGWSASGEEYLAKFTTTGVRPRRSLTLELDRDDDEVLARWHSAVGDSLEIWHLLEFDPPMLDELVLQVIDDDLWARQTEPPAFPGARA